MTYHIQFEIPDLFLLPLTS